MNATTLIEILKERDNLNIHRFKTHTAQIIKEEFVMTKGIKKYLSSLKHTQPNWSAINYIEQASIYEVPVKKTGMFSVSKHNTVFPTYFHKHSYFELDYIYKGSCKYYIDNKEKSFRLNQNDICLINQNVVHAIELEKKDDIVLKFFIPFEMVDLFHFKNISRGSSLKDFFVYSLQRDSTYYSYIIAHPSRNHSLHNLIIRMLYEYIKSDLGWVQAEKNYLSLLVIELMRIAEERCEVTTKDASKDLVFNKIMNRIYQEYSTITLKELSDDFHYNENYLSRLIKQSTGKIFSDILKQIRLNEAEKLLSTTELSVREISTRIGYIKPSYFYKFFKQHHGLTPMEYRNMEK